MTRRRGKIRLKPFDHPFDPSGNMDTRRAWRYNNADEQFDYDESLLKQGHYKEWFYDGLQESQLAYLRQPARVDRVDQEPVAYDQWEAEQPRMWQHKAACADVDPEIFFYGGNNPKLAYLRDDAEWRQYCPQCPVRETCLQAARDSESVGIWGGVYRYHPRNSSNLHNIEELDDRISTS
jgi:transcription factor WhiB